MRPVDHAVPARLEEAVHERLAVTRDRAVERCGAVALPGRRVEDDGAIVGREPVSYTHLDVYKRQQLDWALVGVSAAITAAILALGVLVFQRSVGGVLKEL